MKWLKLILIVALAGGLFVGLDKPSSLKGNTIPPVGRVLSPFTGVWQNGERLDRLPRKVEAPGLKGTVTIVWDDRRVPHIFAENDHDLYFAQGWVTARDRLWQMEFQTHAAAGRLSEIVGRKALPLDRFRRRTGMVHAAQQFLKAAMADPVTREPIEAYTAGVNAWIESLSTRDLPLEYKILGYEPEPWTPLKCAHLLNYMSWLLAGAGNEQAMTLTRERFGSEVMETLFPEFRPFPRPIVPAGTPWNFEPLPVPEVPAEPYAPAMGEGEAETGEPEARGSNNWAIAGSRTRSGFPILASDPHLPLSLPSIWYELQMSAPGVDVYGVSMPGAPAVIVGFNRDFAWGPTNTETDVLDLYRVTFRDETRSEYLHDGEWKKVRWQTEVIGIRDRDPVIDTVPYTHHGPVAYAEGEETFGSRVPAGVALRWTAHDSSNELGAFLRINRASGPEEFREALRFFDTPGQNFVFAHRDGDIAIWHDGRFPLRWPGQGRYLLDGSNPEHDWQGFIPDDHVPHVINPERGFVASANQQPTGPGYPYPMPGNHAPNFRAERIAERLSETSDAVADDMVRLQSDVVSVYARSLLPALLALVEDAELEQDEHAALNELRGWDHAYRADELAPTIFDYWQRFLLERTWRDELGDPDDGLRRPSRDVTAALVLEDPGSEWFDDTGTPERETAKEVALIALRDALDKLESLHGQRGPSWEWGVARGTNIRHIARIPGFGRPALPTGGQYGIVRAITTSAGPSWQMVVEVGPEVRAWGNYPGGQSGNPGSPHYDEFVDPWLEGRVFPLRFLESADDPEAEGLPRTVLR